MGLVKEILIKWMKPSRLYTKIAGSFDGRRVPILMLEILPSFELVIIGEILSKQKTAKSPDVFPTPNTCR
jgi:hypothetical protein